MKIDETPLRADTLDTFKNIIARCPYIDRTAGSSPVSEEKGLAKYSNWNLVSNFLMFTTLAFFVQN